MSKLFNKLEQQIADQAQAYYSDGSQTVSDEEFDEMVAELKSTKPESELLKTGWGYDVTKDSTPGAKVSHKYGEAGSLDKCRTWEEIGKEFQNIELWASLKLDGISVVLYYEDGKLIQALTRGDGHVGIDITDKIKVIMKMTDIRDSEFTGAVRGEIIMPIANFERFKHHNPEAKNPRNSTAGLINSKEISEDLKYLEVVVYTIVGVTKDVRFDTYEDMQHMVTWLTKHFLLVAPYKQIYLSSDNYLTVFNDLKDDWYGRYPADGIVITKDLYAPDVKGSSDDIEIAYHSKAFKFKSGTARTKVVEIEWNMSKTGYAVPRVRVEPVQLAGTTVQYCTGYNAKYVLDNDLGIGSVVEIEKRGEIIPNINQVVHSASPAHLPTCCPSCSGDLQWEGVHLACKNPNCINSVSQDTMIWTNILAPIDNLGEALKEKFFIDIYGEIPSIERLMTEDRYIVYHPSRSAQRKLMYNMFDALYNATIPLATAIKALNIPRFGDVNAEKLAQYPEQVKELIALADSETNIETLKCSSLISLLRTEIGVANTDAILMNLNKVARLQLIQSRIEWSNSAAQTRHKGKVAITGKLSVKRAEFEKALRDAGYTPAEISKDTKFLITDDPNSSSSKNKKADDWGIQKITEKDFKNKYLNPKD